MKSLGYLGGYSGAKIARHCSKSSGTVRQNLTVRPSELTVYFLLVSVPNEIPELVYTGKLQLTTAS